MPHPKKVNNLWSSEQLGLKDLEEAKSMQPKVKKDEGKKDESWIGESRFEQAANATLSA